MFQTLAEGWQRRGRYHVVRQAVSDGESIWLQFKKKYRVIYCNFWQTFVRHPGDATDTTACQWAAGERAGCVVGAGTAAGHDDDDDAISRIIARVTPSSSPSSSSLSCRRHHTAAALSYLLHYSLACIALSRRTNQMMCGPSICARWAHRATHCSNYCSFSASWQPK